MYKTITLIMFIALLAFSCGKKDTTTTTQNTKPQTQQQTQQNNNQNTTQQNTSSTPGKYYSVNSVGSSAGQKGYIDFAWSENDKAKNLSDYKGKVILLNFWATWCPPCRKELPALSEIANDMKGKDFQMIGISVDENPAALANFLKSNTLSYTILHQNNGLLEKYMSVSGNSDNVIPQSFIIDKNGKVVEAIIGSKSKEDFVKLINKYM